MLATTVTIEDCFFWVHTKTVVPLQMCIKMPNFMALEIYNLTTILTLKVKFDVLGLVVRV